MTACCFRFFFKKSFSKWRKMLEQGCTQAFHLDLIRPIISSIFHDN